MNNASNLVRQMMDSMKNPNDKMKVRSFLNFVLMGISSNAELSYLQETLLESILSEFVRGMHLPVLESSHESQVRAMQIAIWVNGAHVANKTA